eukprot:scaffold22976_cov62-Phaeocystis_antarctica.AAC.2
MPRARYAQGHPNHSHRTSRLWQHISNKTVRGWLGLTPEQPASTLPEGLPKAAQGSPESGQ